MHIGEDNSQGKEGPHEITHVELESEDGHDPGRGRGTDVRPHNNRNGLLKGKQTSIDETDGHDGSGSRRLHGGGNKGSRK